MKSLLFLALGIFTLFVWDVNALRTPCRPPLRDQSKLYFTGRLDNFISEDQIMFLKTIGYPLAAYLTFYKPIERTQIVFDKVSELLRVGESQNLLEGIGDYLDEDE